MGTPMRWRVAALALACCVAIPAGTAAAVTLTVAVFPSVDQVVAAALPAWRAQHPDIEIKLVSREFSDHHNAMALALAGGAGTVDVMALELARLRRFTDGSGLENLAAPPYDATRYRDRYAAYAYRLGANERGEQMALPADLGPGALFYRADLLRRAHVDEAELTRSWASYVAAGKAIKAATGAYLLGHARDLKDIMIRAGVADGEGLFFDRAGRCLVEGPRFVHAFELALELRRAGLDARVNTWSNEWVESLRRGTVATQVMGGWLAGHLERRYALDSSGQWRIAQLPGHAYVFWGGTFYALPKPAATRRRPGNSSSS